MLVPCPLYLYTRATSQYLLFVYTSETALINICLPAALLLLRAVPMPATSAYLLIPTDLLSNLLLLLLWCLCYTREIRPIL